MLHALLHGKLDPRIAEPHRLEDALTSAVFGTLVMGEAWSLLASWLGVASGSDSPDEPRECWFWPRLFGAVEPDVILRLGSLLVVVEAKYRSGRHDLLGDNADDRPVDQIVRQHQAVSPPHDHRPLYPEPLERAVRECRLLQVFVVDARRLRRARREYAESKALLPPDAQLNLVTWQSLYKMLLEPAWSGRRWAADLRAYLRLAGLATFHGIQRRIAREESVAVIEMWKPYSRRTKDPELRLAAAVLAAVPAIRDLRHWRAPADRTKGKGER